MRGIRGAITVAENTKAEIEKATLELLTAMLEENDITADDVDAVTFTATKDVTAAYPAVAARKIEGFKYVPLTCMQEMEVEGSLRLCIRALFFTSLNKSKEEIRHVYLKGAANLRRDLARG